MTKEQLDALFAMKEAFPGFGWNVGADGVMRMEVWLNENQIQFMHDAQQMMAAEA